MSMASDYLELPTTAVETAELVSIVVRQCGCGCTSSDSDLTAGGPNCSAVRALRHRRFVLGVLFARTLRRQLERQEWRYGSGTAAV
jgi:hypothetical protein